MAIPSFASCASEFLGTYLLVLTVGCNVLGANAVWGGVSIACVLMASIYALGDASGANFNPAVSLALGLAGKMEGGWVQVGVYSGVQIVAGLCASLSYCSLFGRSFNLAPAIGFGWWEPAICEIIYTFMLCFVVLNTAASKKLGGKNRFYGLAIGFVIVAGAFGAGAISGGCFNPAVAIGIDTSSAQLGFGWCIAYTVFEVIGSVLAVGLFYVVRPEETSDEDPPSEPAMSSKLMAEFIGTFMLVLTLGLNVLGRSRSAPVSVAASLMCMIYALGDISGAHFNPAVTIAILARGKIDGVEAGKYIGTQLVAGVLAALLYRLMYHGQSFPLGPGRRFGWGDVIMAEFGFTFLLCFVVLCLATVRAAPAAEFTGFVVGSCVIVGGSAIGAVSGGSLNPAVSWGISAAAGTKNDLIKGLVYSIIEVLAGAASALAFRMVYPSEKKAEAGPLREAP